MRHRRKGYTRTSIRSLSPLFLSVIPFIFLAFITAEYQARQQDEPMLEAVAAEAENTSGAGRFYVRELPSLSGLINATNFSYDIAVFQALRKMNLSADHIDVWIAEHPQSALLHLRCMKSAMQRDVASTALFIRSCNPNIDEKTAWREAAAIVHYSDKYGVPSTLTTAIAYAESTFNPAAVSPKGAEGVMQVMWRIHNGLLESNGITGRDSLADPEKGIAAGCLLMSRYIRAYGTIQDAMTRYYGKYSARYQNRITRYMANIETHHANVN